MRAKLVTNGRKPNFRHSGSYIAPGDIIDPEKPDCTWSIVVNNLDIINSEGDVSFLVQAAPHHLLVKGLKFRLIDGTSTYISGEII